MPYAAALSPRTSLRVRSTEDEDSPERATAVRSPRPVGERAAERCSRAQAVDQGGRQSEARLTAGFFMGNFKFFSLPRWNSNRIFLL